MSPAVLETPRRNPCAGERRRPPRRDPQGRPASLDVVIGSAWAGVTAHCPVACPVCGGRMEPRYGAAGSEPVGGRCRDCGSVLG